MSRGPRHCRPSFREAISSGDPKAEKHGRRTIILPDDLRVWLKTLPDARKPFEENKPRLGLLHFGRAAEPTDDWKKRSIVGKPKNNKLEKVQQLLHLI
jgi:hypothetical protein